MMTNGKVATAVSVGGGRMLTVDYGSGSRQVKVPPEVQVISNMPGTLAMIRVGQKLSIATFPAMGERPARQMITIAKADLPK
jgi:methenyltetrahydromethanopterin cyclohydrolase